MSRSFFISQKIASIVQAFLICTQELYCGKITSSPGFFYQLNSFTHQTELHMRQTTPRRKFVYGTRMYIQTVHFFKYPHSSTPKMHYII